MEIKPRLFYRAVKNLGRPRPLILMPSVFIKQVLEKDHKKSVNEKWTPIVARRVKQLNIVQDANNWDIFITFKSS